MSIDTELIVRAAEYPMSASLNCLSALMSIDTFDEDGGPFGNSEWGLNCLSALMSIDTVP